MIAGTWNLSLSHTHTESELPPAFPSFSSSSSWSSWPIQHILQFPSINNHEVWQPARYQLLPPSPGSDRDLTQIQHCKRIFTLQRALERSCMLFKKKNTHVHPGSSHLALDVHMLCISMSSLQKVLQYEHMEMFYAKHRWNKDFRIKAWYRRKSSLGKSSTICPSGKANGLQ